MSTFTARVHARDSSFRLLPPSPKSWRRRQVFESLVSEEAEEADRAQVSDTGSDTDTNSINSDHSVKLSSYNRLMQEHLRCQMDNVVASYQRSLQARSAGAFAHRERMGLASSSQLAELQAMLPFPLCKDFSQLTVGEGPAASKQSQLPQGVYEKSTERSQALADISRPEAREYAAQDRCREIMGELAAHCS